MIFLLLVTACSCFAAYKLDFDGFFIIKKVNVNPTNLIQETYLDSLCRSLLLGRSIFSNLSQQEKIILSEPLVKEVRFLRRYPDCLKVQVEERVPVALVNLGELLPVDSEGFILQLANKNYPLELPILTPRTVAFNGQEENSSRASLNKESLRLLEAALVFRRLAPELLPQVSEFTLNEQGKITLVTLDDGIKVVLGKWVKEENVRYLQWMLGQFARLGEKPVLVDLSFEGQIIVKNKNDS